MADMYDAIANTTTCPEHDDISILLHQFLFRTSMPSPSFMSQTHFSPENQQPPPPTSLLSGPTRFSGADSSAGAYFPTNVSVETIDNDLDDYDCENEEDFEALMEETNANTNTNNHRHSSKRSRAAEVHNLSEKRRRSRINEKMKALQNLIPNSNKTDKASMLDEAIEYLKQLQLQVQMLTMRNGLSMYPMCLPDVLQPNELSEKRISFSEGNGLGSVFPDTSLFSLAKQCNNLQQPSVANIINSKSSHGLESSNQGPSQYNAFSEEFCREDMLCQAINMEPSGTNLAKCADLGVGIPFDLRAPGLIDDKLMEANRGLQP